MKTRPDLLAAIDWLAQSALDEQLDTQRRILTLEAEVDALRYQNLTLREALAALAPFPAGGNGSMHALGWGHA